MMAGAGGMAWLPQETVGQNPQSQLNPFAALTQNQQWGGAPNQHGQDATGARPAAGPMPAPLNDPAKTRPPAKEEKLL
jgi:hypothetical protein